VSGVGDRPAASPGTSTLLSIRGLRVERAGAAIVQDLDLTVAAGEICAVMGASGAGKTTVLRVIAALQAFTSGQVEVGGVALAAGATPPESRLRALRKRVGVVFQAHALFEHLTAMENVMLAPVHALGQSRTEAAATAERLLDTLGVASRAHAYPRQLSGGEAQRVAIARALAPDPHLLLMDEPTSALDAARRASLGVSLRTLAGQGRGLLIVTHDAEFAQAVADRVMVMERGALAQQA
jgi:ABC-type polar amino acid transport system ATPase subunit